MSACWVAQVLFHLCVFPLFFPLFFLVSLLLCIFGEDEDADLIALDYIALFWRLTGSLVEIDGVGGLDGVGVLPAGGHFEGLGG